MFSFPGFCFLRILIPRKESRMKKALLWLIFFGSLVSIVYAQTTPTIVRKFEGESYTGWIPPDTMGAVGPNHCVEMINGSFAIYDKTTGTKITSMSLNDFWSEVGYSGYTFDPRIVYDKYAGRWYAVSADNPSHANNILFAYTDSSDPTGTWHKIKIDSDPTDTRWADFPTLGFDQDGVYIAANMFAISGGSTLVSVWAIPKVSNVPDTTKVNALPSSSIYGYSLFPTYDYDPGDTERPYYLVSRYDNSTLRLSEITWNGTSATITAGPFVSVTYYPSPPNARQPGNHDDIDTGDGRIINAVVQNGKLWAIRGAKLGDDNAGAVWYKVDIPASGSASLDYEGTLLDEGADIYYASIAVNEEGDIGFGFTHSSDTEFAGAYISGIDDGVALDILEYQAGFASYYISDGSRNRWGDYSITLVDPEDDTLFWSLQEYAYASTQWKTCWVAFRVPEPATILLLILPVSLYLLGRRKKDR